MTEQNKEKKLIDSAMLRRAGALITLKGKNFVTFKGLLWIAHQHGLQELTVQIVKYDGETKEAICMATLKGTRGVFQDVADASPANVNRMMTTCTLRMASTRAKARVLRDYLGIGICSLEELPGDDND